MTSIVPSGGGGGGSSIVGLESVPYTYLPNGWDAGWKAAKAAASNTPAQILFFGDSIQAGAGGVSDWKKTYPHLIRESLRNSLGGLRGDYFPSYGLSQVSGAVVAGTPPWSAMNALVTSPSGRASTFAWHSMTWDNTVGASAYYQQTFTSPEACTAMDLFYMDYNSGTWNYAIDGGVDNLVTNTNAGNAGLAPIKKISISGLASGIHTLALGKQSALTVCTPCGVAIYPAGTAGGGLSIARFHSAFSALALDYVTTAQGTPTRLELNAGISPQGGGGVGTTFGFPTQPHLLIVEIGVNDCSGTGNQTNYGTALRRLIQAVRKGRANASIILHIVCNPDVELSDTGPAATFHPENWPAWMQIMMQYAGVYNCAVVNTHAKWGEYPSASGFLSNAQNVHPLDAGHADIASTILGLL